MLALANSGSPRGTLTLPSGEPIATKKLASFARISSGVCERLIAELRDAQVFDESECIISCPTLIRDERRSALGKRTGKRGGNPHLKRDQKPLTADVKANGNLSSPGEGHSISQDEAPRKSGPFTGEDAA
jgi:hypothetical protein